MASCYSDSAEHKGRGWDWTYQFGLGEYQRAPRSQHRQARRSVERVLVEMAQGRLRSRREFDELENIRCGFRPARSYKELIMGSKGGVFLFILCMGSVHCVTLDKTNSPKS